MSTRFNISGYRCDTCGKGYVGKNSRKKADACCLNPIPKTNVIIGLRYIWTYSQSYQLAIIITGIKPRAVLNDQGWPVSHTLAYSATTFAYKDENREWMHEAHEIILTHEEVLTLMPWTQAPVTI